MSGFATVAVIGAGTMGHALALVHALAGASVRLQDVDARALERAQGLVEAALATLVEAGEIDEAAASAARGRVLPVGALEDAVRDAALVVESVVEDPGVKRSVFRAIGAAAGAEAIVASNTSYLDVFPLMPEALRPRAAIAHWYTPPYIVDLVDLVPGPDTAPAVLDRLEAYYRGLGKRPVRFARMLAGYVANRLQAAMSAEIFRLLDEEGIGPEVIDASIVHGLGLRLLLMGQLRKSDYTGLDMVRRALANRSYTPPPARARSATLEALLAAGRSGVAAGAGFYDYAGRPAAELFRARDLKLLALRRAFRAIGEV